MTPERFAALDASGGPLTPAEQSLGWHFCPKFDGLLTIGEGPGPCPCGIHGDSPLQLTRDPEHYLTGVAGTRDTFDPPPEELDKFGFPIRTLEQQLADLKAEIASHDPDLDMPIVGLIDDALILKFNEALDRVTIEALAMTNNTMMTSSRWLELSINGGHITSLERMEGWHYCPRLDDKLTKIQNNICKLCGADQGPDPLSLVVCPTDEQLDLGGHTKESTIHQHDGKWWFWDETGMHRHGPYSSYEETRKDLNHYCHVYLGEPEDPS